MKRAQAITGMLNVMPVFMVVLLWAMLLVKSQGVQVPSLADQLYLSVVPLTLASGEPMDINWQYQFCFVGPSGFAVALLVAFGLSWAGRCCFQVACERIGTGAWWCVVIVWMLGLLGAAHWLYRPIVMTHSMYAWSSFDLLLPALRNFAAAGVWSILCFSLLRPWRSTAETGWGRAIASGVGIVLMGHLLASAMYVFMGLSGTE